MEPDQSKTGEARVRRAAWLVGAGILGAATGLAILLAITASRHGTRLPEFGPRELDEAEARWAATGIEDYRIAVRVTGRQAAEYRVEVRDGEVVSASRNGRPLTQKRTFATWSVPGMFGTIRSDVRNLERHREGTADRQTPQVLLRGRFHPEWGYPQQYHRTELQQFRNNTEVTWEVLEFERLNEHPAPPKRDASSEVAIFGRLTGCFRCFCE